MLEYQNRIEGLLTKISNNLVESSSMLELEKRFHKDPFFRHAPILCRFCNPAERRIREESVLFAEWVAKEKLKNLPQVLEILQEKAYYISTDYEVDNLFYKHVIECIKKLMGNARLQKQILRLTPPVLNSWTENIIRSGLNLSKKERITNEHIQTLFLSAFFHPLRQNVGSCFATAPAIFIQKEQPEQFFTDLEDLLNVGILKRTFSGHEHAIPISTSWGPGILNKVIEVRYEEMLWQSSELVGCLDKLHIFEKKSSLKEKHLNLKKILFDTIKLKEGERISLNEIVKRILQNHHQLDDKEIDKPFQVTSIKVNEIYYAEHSISEPFGKYQQFEESWNEAKYALINFHENPLLKTWEYTFASFAETQSKFYKWNLYTSLGFDSKKPFSIAGCIYSYLDERLKFYEEKIKHHDSEYEQEFFRVKMLEKRVIDTESEHMAGWAKVEYQNHLNEMNFHRGTRDGYIDKSERLSKFLPKILETYDELFPKYFQEVYDASMQEVSDEIFEDSPAGFRLLYKHGRQDPSLWSYIRSKGDFVNYLKEFFINTEFEISAQENLEEFKEEYSEIITNIIHLIQTDNFILAAFQRICSRYEMSFPSHDLSKLDTWPYKPWSYISGGTTERLMQHYYKRESEFTQQVQKIATEAELFAFLIDTVREFTQDQLKYYSSNSERSMVMLSPVHAFLFKPGWLPLEEVWDKDLYSFSWIRDYFVNPQQQFLQSIHLTPLEVHYFFNTYFARYPYFSIWIKENVHWPSYSISLVEFREMISSCLKKAPPNLSPYAVSLEVIDSWIYECFPLTPSSELYSRCVASIKELGLKEPQLERARWVTDQIINSSKMTMFLRPCDLFEIMKRIVSIVFEKVTFEEDWSLKILNALRSQGFFMPRPFKFADTNWPYYNFSFIVSPATLKLELWRMNDLGSKGFPMHQWKKWFTEEKASDWNILTKPEEYLS